MLTPLVTGTNSHQSPIEYQDELEMGGVQAKTNSEEGHTVTNLLEGQRGNRILLGLGLRGEGRVHTGPLSL